MSYFEECLTLGQLLSQREKIAIYKYLLELNSREYSETADKLVQDKSLLRSFANGEALLKLEANTVSYKPRKIGDSDFLDTVRERNIGSIPIVRAQKLKKFLAQCDLDIISNYPLSIQNFDDSEGYGINTYPFYDLNYYSDGHGKIRGFVKKFKLADSEILTKLRTL